MIISVRKPRRHHRDAHSQVRSGIARQSNDCTASSAGSKIRLPSGCASQEVHQRAKANSAPAAPRESKSDSRNGKPMVRAVRGALHTTHHTSSLASSELHYARPSAHTCPPHASRSLTSSRPTTTGGPTPSAPLPPASLLPARIRIQASRHALHAASPRGRLKDSRGESSRQTERPNRMGRPCHPLTR